jgi:hypothetical protein
MMLRPVSAWSRIISDEAVSAAQKAFEAASTETALREAIAAALPEILKTEYRAAIK